MNLPNKLTISRLILSIFIIIVLLGSGFITSLFGIEMPKLFINEAIVIYYSWCFIYNSVFNRFL